MPQEAALFVLSLVKAPAGRCRPRAASWCGAGRLGLVDERRREVGSLLVAMPEPVSWTRWRPG